jgi:hypothetical protein
MLKVLEPFLAKNAAPTSADLKAAIAEVETRSAEAAQLVDQLHRRRTKATVERCGRRSARPDRG